MEILLVFLCASLTLAVPLGTPCIYPLSDLHQVGFDDNVNSLLCGTNTTIEKLTCDEEYGLCLGTNHYSGCMTGKCASGFFCSNVGVCISCMKGCKTCTNSNTCVETSEGYFYSTVENKSLSIPIAHCLYGDNDTCFECDIGYTLSSNSSLCLACANGCLMCTTENGCEICGPGLFWNETSCINGVKNCLINGANSPITCVMCNFGYYLYTDSTGVDFCLKGAEMCAYVNPSGYCRSCQEGYYWDHVSQSCLKIEIEGCNSTTTGANCKACSAHYSLDNFCMEAIPNCMEAESSSVCRKCIAGFFWSMMEVKCLPCIEGCAECTDHSLKGCKACLPSYFSTPNIGCQACIDNCYTCNTQGACITCKAGYRYDDYTKTCQQCMILGCEKCESALQYCDICVEGRYPYGGKCISSTIVPNCQKYSRKNNACVDCVAGYYLNSTASLLNSCQACALSSGCKKCSKLGCLECEDGYTLNNDLCSATPAIPVANCIVFSNVCLRCEVGYYLTLSNTCSKILTGMVPNCEAHKYVNGLVCDECSEGFYMSSSTTCTPATSVLNCAEYNKFSDTCKKCILGYFASNDGKSCLQCSISGQGLSGCTECYYGACTACEPDYFTKNGYCVLKSSAAYCLEIVNNACVKCEPGYELNSNSDCIASSSTMTTSCSYFGTYPTIGGIKTYCALCGYLKYAVTTSSGTSCTGQVTNPIQGCISYNDTTHCQLCDVGYYFVTGNCVSSNPIVPHCAAYKGNALCTVCEHGYSVSQDFSKCYACRVGCADCSESACLVCKDGYYLNNGICTLCDEGCSTCSAISCTSCKDGYYLRVGVCYKGAANCTSTAGPDTCLTCSANLGIYHSTPCSKCKDNNCDVCENPDSPKSCTVCSGGYYLGADKDCLVQCDKTGFCNTHCFSSTSCGGCVDGYYVNGAGICTKCANNCAKCSGDTASSCQECMPGYFLSVFDNTCLPCFDDGIDATYRIAKCKPPRKNFNESGYLSEAYTPTVSCQPGSYLVQTCVPNDACNIPDSNSTDRCAKCDEGYYLDNAFNNSDFTCYTCNINNCGKCSGKSKCEECKTGFFLTLVNNVTTCSECTGAGCSACKNNATVCTACNAGFKLVGSACTKCTATDGAKDCYCGSAKFWNSTTGACISCMKGCVQCSNENTCEVCDPLYYMDKGICKQYGYLPEKCSAVYPMDYCRTCVAGTFYNASASIATCDDCSLVFPDCALCNADKCLLCKTGYALNSTNCTACALPNCLTCSSLNTCDQCKEGYYFNGLNCMKCSSGCTTCYGKKSCQICDTTFYMNENNTCSPCVGNCNSCSNSTNCMVCSDGYYLNNSTCESCTDTCKSCVNATDIGCTECVANARKNADGICECNSGLLFDTINRRCSSTSSSSSGVYLFTGVMSLLVILLAIL